MSKPYIDGAKPFFGTRIDAILADIKETLQSGELTQGKHLKEFEKRFSDYVGSTYALGVNSGGTALELALKALNIVGKEVIVPTNTFVASASAVIQAGGTPVLAEIRRGTLCLDASDVHRKITAKTAGIMLVHIFGLIPPDYIGIKELCRENGLFLLEDAAHAIGASLSGIMAGNLGDAACFSFYATKIITTGEGGMVTTSRQDIYEKVLSLRNHGRSLNKPVYVDVSNNYRLAELPAILGRHQMEDIRDTIIRRNKIASRYRERLSGIKGLELLPEFENIVNSYWRFPAYLNDNIDRTALQKAMHENLGVRITWMYEPLCHLQPVFSERYGYKQGDFPVGEKCLEQLICLPMHGWLSDDDVNEICDGLTAEISRLGR